MRQVTEYLMNIRRIIKLHESMLKDVCQKYDLTLAEATIISFLHNNPGKDTAADIVELRMMQKGNVSQAVEALAKKSLLRRRQDEIDRRKIHLSLTENATPIVKEVKKIGKNFHEELFAEVSPEEMEIFQKVNEQIQRNTQRAITRRENNEG